MPVLRLPKFGKQIEYAYITGRVRVMKTKLIPGEMYSRMMKMSTSEVVRYLEENQYKDEIDALSKDYSGVELIEHATFANLAKTFKKLADISIDEQSFLILEYLRRWDVWNIKTLLRGKFSGISNVEIAKYFVPAGELTAEYLEELSRKKTIQDIISAFDETDYSSALAQYDGKNLASLENALDKLYYFRMERAVGGTLSVGGGLLLKYIRREIDIRNLITLFRMNRAGADADTIQENLIPGGKLHEELSHMAGQSFGEFLRGLEGYPFWPSISDIATPNIDTISIVEARLKAYLIRYVWTLSGPHPLSILPVLAYMISKETEIVNIRKIVRGKEAGLPPELIEDLVVIA